MRTHSTVAAVSLECHGRAHAVPSAELPERCKGRHLIPQGPTEPTLYKVPAETPKTPGGEEQRPVPFLLELAGNPARPKFAR